MRPQERVSPKPIPEAAIAVAPGRPPCPFEVTVASGPGASAAARAAIATWIDGSMSNEMVIDLRLLLSELVTNSVRHADASRGAGITVRAEVLGDVLRLEVGDHGNRGSIARRAPDPEVGGGFGLHVVDALSRRWGVDRELGTRVWAELAFPAGT